MAVLQSGTTNYKELGDIGLNLSAFFEMESGGGGGGGGHVSKVLVGLVSVTTQELSSCTGIGLNKSGTEHAFTNLSSNSNLKPEPLFEIQTSKRNSGYEP